jgi:predicted nucleic acid-binding protein
MEEGKFKCITNILAIDEIIWKIRKEVVFSSAIMVGKSYVRAPNLEIVEVTSKIIKEVFNFIEKYQLKLRDAIHVVSMLENDVSTMITEDPDFKKVKEIKALTSL